MSTDAQRSASGPSEPLLVPDPFTDAETSCATLTECALILDDVAKALAFAVVGRTGNLATSAVLAAVANLRGYVHLIENHDT